MKRIVSVIVLFCSISTLLYAGNPVRKSAIGISGGYDGSNETFIGEAYYQRSDFNVLNRAAELRFGITGHSYRISYAELNDLDIHSIGLFGDLVLYPFNNIGLFTGARWEGVNINWFSAASKTRLAGNGHSLSDVFTGTSFFLQIGYHFKLSERLGLRLYGQPGFQEIGIGNMNAINTDNDAIERKYNWVCNLNIGMTFRL
jgi:hypothetical protein